MVTKRYLPILMSVPQTALLLYIIIYIIISVQNIRNTFLLSFTPFCPQNSLYSSGHGLYNVSNAFHRDAVPCWLQYFPQVWMSFGWWTILDTHGKLLSVKNPAALQFLTPLKPVHLAPTNIPRSKALSYFILPIHPLNGTHTQSMSHLCQC